MGTKGEILRDTQSSGSCLPLLRSLRLETNYPFYEKPALSDMSPLTNVKLVLMVSDDSGPFITIKNSINARLDAAQIRPQRLIVHLDDEKADLNSPW